MRRRIIDEQRDISYGELVALQQEFETQLDENGVIFDDDESYEEALGDFIQQYMEGDDNPMIDMSTANVRPVRDSKRRRVRDGRRPVRNMRRRVKDSETDIKAAIDEVLADYFPNLTVDDYHIYGDNEEDGLLAQPEIDGCDMYVFSSEYAANAYILDGYGIDCVDGAMRDDEWVDYLINGGVEPDVAENLIATEDWQSVVEIILDSAGAAWFLTSYAGEVFHNGGYAIYF